VGAGTRELDAAREAFERGDWRAARERFEAAAAAEPSAEALDGLSQALWWLGEVQAAGELRARAFEACRREGDLARAASIAIMTAAEYRIAGNPSLGNGWLGRARRMLADLPECDVHAWFAIELAKREDEAGGRERHAREALAIARRLGRPDLEACGLSHVGLARVEDGAIEQGLELLDEAMATAVAAGGGASDPLAIGEACCMTLSACERVADVQRARDFGRAVIELTERGNQTPLRAWCRAVYAEFLVASGRWQEAERQLERSLEEYAGLADLSRVPALAALAELRVRQGRLEEAARLVDGCEDRPAALAPVVALLLARGDAGLASEKVAQRLTAVEGEPATEAPVLALAARVALARGDAAAASATAERLDAAARAARRDDLAAVATVLAARAERQAGDGASGPRAVAGRLEAAVERLAALELPLEEGEARLELARALAAAGRPGLAVEQARLALAGFERLGAAAHADEAAACLRELGAPGRPAPRTADALTRREHEVLALLAEGLSNAAIAERLVISPKTAEHHVGRVLGKLGLRSRAEAAAYAVRAGARRPS
jgi:DNA-binding CsgD family transcriptional regulator/tetratricopeptide (TPR) repeat protein